MKLLITCGPSYEPIDDVRRITNASTGRLGITLANRFQDAGNDVTVLKGIGSTWPEPLRVTSTHVFTTNDDLADILEQEARQHRYAAVLHAAALCDFKVTKIASEEGKALELSGKISSRAGNYSLELEPATKVLPLLRKWFSGAQILGWKYEVVGTREHAIEQGWLQVKKNSSEGCVVNGTAYGDGFGICWRGGHLEECANLDALGTALIKGIQSPALRTSGGSKK